MNPVRRWWVWVGGVCAFNAILILVWYVVYRRSVQPPVIGPPHERYQPALREATIYKWADGGEGKAAKLEVGWAVFGNGVTLHFDLADDRYAYVLSFNADGGIYLLWPRDADDVEGEDIVPSKVRRIDYPGPHDVKRVTTLELIQNPQGGSQAFALVLSATPLPPFREWRRAYGELPWDGKEKVSRPYKRGQDPKWHARARWVRDEEGVQDPDQENWPHLLPLLNALKKGTADEIHIWAFHVYREIKN